MRLLYAPHRDGRLRMSDLAEALGITARSVTALLDELPADAQRTLLDTMRQIAERLQRPPGP